MGFFKTIFLEAQRWSIPLMLSRWSKRLLGLTESLRKIPVAVILAPFWLLSRHWDPYDQGAPTGGSTNLCGFVVLCHQAAAPDLFLLLRFMKPSSAGCPHNGSSSSFLCQAVQGKHGLACLCFPSCPTSVLPALSPLSPLSPAECPAPTTLDFLRRTARAHNRVKPHVAPVQGSATEQRWWQQGRGSGREEVPWPEQGAQADRGAARRGQ